MSDFVAILLGVGSLIVVYFWTKMLRKVFRWAMNVMNPPNLPEDEESIK